MPQKWASGEEMGMPAAYPGQTRAAPPETWVAGGPEAVQELPLQTAAPKKGTGGW
jgi:hypothetical protein